ncbi:MAG: hypothetical protein CL799_07320 [Chromatiales bacterium]|jgi:hypothetical protein|nr:hypothetical protein [Chromatiales bacterium]
MLHTDMATDFSLPVTRANALVDGAIRRLSDQPIQFLSSNMPWRVRIILDTRGLVPSAMCKLIQIPR